MIATLNWIILILTITTSTGLLLSRDWRWSLGFLAAQYFCVFWMVQTHWPISMAAAKLVTGWMACAILGLTQLTAKGRDDVNLKWPQGRLFQIFTSGMVVAVTYALSLRVASWLGLSLPIAWGGVLLIGLGLLQLGITAEAFQVILGLLTVMAGFEILYAAVESSILVASLLVIVNLGLAMTGAYFLNISQQEEII
jgi:hypothetical protein